MLIYVVLVWFLYVNIVSFMRLKAQRLYNIVCKREKIYMKWYNVTCVFDYARLTRVGRLCASTSQSASSKKGDISPENHVGFFFSLSFREQLCFRWREKKSLTRLVQKKTRLKKRKETKQIRLLLATNSSSSCSSSPSTVTQPWPVCVNLVAVEEWRRPCCQWSHLTPLSPTHYLKWHADLTSP